MSGKDCIGQQIFRDIKLLIQIEKNLVKLAKKHYGSGEIENLLGDMERKILEAIAIQIDVFFHSTSGCQGRGCAQCRKLKEIKEILEQGEMLKRLLQMSFIDKSKLIKEVYQKIKKVMDSQF